MKNPYNIFVLLFGCMLMVPKVMAQSDYYSYTLRNFRKADSFKEVIDIKNPDLKRLNAVLFFITNETRVKQKSSILSYHPLLEKAAVIHSNEMVKRNFFNHFNVESEELNSPKDRARYAGISNPYIAENIAEGFVLRYKVGTPVYPSGKGIFRYDLKDDPIAAHTYLSLGESILKDWMNSPQHRSNIISKKAVQLGCGTAFFLKDDFNDMPTVYATQNFQLHESVDDVVNEDQ